MTSYFEQIPAVKKYYDEHREKIQASPEIFALAVASMDKPPYGISHPYARCENISGLVVPNADINDIEESRVDETTKTSIPVVEYLDTLYTRYAQRIYSTSSNGSDADAAASEITSYKDAVAKLTDEQHKKVKILMRTAFIAYANVTPPNGSGPTFAPFLLYKGRHKSGDDDINNINNYELVSKEALKYFHEPKAADAALKNDVSTIRMDTYTIRDASGETKTLEYPEYDPRIGVARFKPTAAGREVSSIINKLREKNKEGGDADAAEEPEGDEETSKTPKKKEKKPKKEKSKKPQEADEAAAENAAPPTPLPPAIEESPKAPPANTAVEDAMDIDAPVPPPLERAFHVKDANDLALLGVPALQHSDMSHKCVWVDRMGTTGHTATPSIAELNSLLRLYTAPDSELSYPSDLAVRLLLTIAGKHNPRVAMQPFIDTATKGLVNTPVLSSMDINQLRSALTPDLTHAINDHVIRTALTDEAVRNAYAQFKAQAVPK